LEHIPPVGLLIAEFSIKSAFFVKKVKKMHFLQPISCIFQKKALSLQRNLIHHNYDI